MKNITRQLKRKLNHILEQMAVDPSAFVMHPGKDFTRNRLLPFDEMLRMLITMGGQTLNKELYAHFEDSFVDCPTASAFVQQRGKIKPEALQEALYRFNNRCFMDTKKYRGYRLIAADGSDVNIAKNPESDTYMVNGDNAGYNQIHVNALYDVLNHVYLDAVLEPKTKYNEQRAAGIMCKRSAPKGSILLADRGYGGFNLFETLKRSGINYLIRVRNDFIKETQALPMEQLDTVITVELRTTQTKRDKEDYDKILNVHYIAGKSKYGKNKKGVTWDYESPCRMTLRVLRFEIAPGTYETIITSLPREKFTLEEIKHLYHLRWGIETSFRDLKYTIGMTNFHARKENFIAQEIFARLIMYNLAERAINAVVVYQDKNRQYEYKIAFSDAAYIIRDYVRTGHEPPDSIENRILRYITPIRPDRADKRKMKPKSVVCFLYRVA